MFVLMMTIFNAGASAKKLPHVILMLADDLGSYEVGFHNPRAITPNIDELVHDGVLLERHYAYHMCGPTRSATMTGRLPFHNNQENVNDINATEGADLRMTMLPAKLKQAGYATSMIGKSHLGARSVAHLPINRGFDQHFGFLGGGEDHFTQVSSEDKVVGELVDLWRDHGPAYGENGTFSGFLYSKEAERVIMAHNTSTPLFMYLAWHLVHSPLEAPEQYWDPKCADDEHRQLEHAMTTALDEGVGNVTRALQRAGMWNDTLLIFFSDNGGPLVTTGKSGNNFPLKGGKTTDFEGGTRVAAFLSGGFLPVELRGSINSAYIHACDWYSTLCGLAGVDPTDTTAGRAIPPIDSIDQWSTILIRNASMAQGARQEMVLAWNINERGTSAASGYNGALISGAYKVVTGHQGGSGFWTGPIHPNATGPADPKHDGSSCHPVFACCDGCLFNIQDDPTEHDELRVSMPGKYKEMHEKLLDYAKGVFQTDYIEPGIECLDAYQAKIYYKGFRGPLCFHGKAPVVPTPKPAPGIGFQLQHTHRKQTVCLTNKLGLTDCDGPREPPLPGQWIVEKGALQSTDDASDPRCIKIHETAGWSCENAPHVSMGHCASAGGAHKTNFFKLIPSTKGMVLIQSHDCPKLCIAPRKKEEEAFGEETEGLLIGLLACTDQTASWTQAMP